MLKEYLLSQGSGTGRWSHGMPGVQICRFSLPEPVQEPLWLPELPLRQELPPEPAHKPRIRPAGQPFLPRLLLHILCHSA